MERYRNIEVERVGADPLAELEAHRIVVPEKNPVSNDTEDEEDDLDIDLETEDLVDDSAEVIYDEGTNE
jgi:hypothetical protein